MLKSLFLLTVRIPAQEMVPPTATNLFKTTQPEAHLPDDSRSHQVGNSD